ncbi:MAG: hypothetical protein ACI3YC_00850 [Alloprevotella sp.]
MKRIQELFCALLIGMLSVGFVSCGDDDDAPLGANAAETFIGTWTGYREAQLPTEKSMTAKFYEDGTCEIWWYDNPLITSYYFSGEYIVTDNQLRLVGTYGEEGDCPYMDYDRTVAYSIKNGVLTFHFGLANSYLTKENEE